QPRSGRPVSGSVAAAGVEAHLGPRRAGPRAPVAIRATVRVPLPVSPAGPMRARRPRLIRRMTTPAFRRHATAFLLDPATGRGAARQPGLTPLTERTRPTHRVRAVVRCAR